MTPEQMELVERELTPISEIVLRAHFDDCLDDMYGEVSVAGLVYPTSSLLRQADPVAYQCGLNDWLDTKPVTYVRGDYYDSAEAEKLLDTHAGD